MKNNKYFWILLSLLTIVGVTGLTFWTNAQNKENKPDTKRVSIEYKAKLLSVESIIETKSTEIHNKFEVLLKNNYDRPVSVYRMEYKDKNSDDLTINGVEAGSYEKGSYLPNETFKGYFHASPEGKINLTISAVIFEDGSGDGDEDALTTLKENREGVMLAYQQIIPLLREKLKNFKGSVTKDSVEALKKEIKEISDEKILDNYKGSFYDTKSRIAYEIEDIFQKSQNDSTAKFDLEMQKSITNLENNLNKMSRKTLNSSQSKERRQK